MAVSTRQLRLEYPEAVRSTSPLKCDFSGTIKVPFIAGGVAYPSKRIDLRFHFALLDWARAIASVMRFHNYEFRETSGGTLNCRLTTGGYLTSTHAHAIAGDWNPSKNGYRRVFGKLSASASNHQNGILQWGRYTDMPPEMIVDIKAIKTVSGSTAVAWGGDWRNVKDPMHFQPAASRLQIEQGIDFSTVKGWDEYKVWTEIEEEEMEGFLPVVFGDGVGERKHKRSDVAAIAAMMERAYGVNLDWDGEYDQKMLEAVKANLGGDGGSVYGNLYDNLIWDLAVKAAESVKPAEGIDFEVETVSVVKGIKKL